MGGRGSFSGLLRTIDDVLGIGDKRGIVKEIPTDKFDTLEFQKRLKGKRGGEENGVGEH